MNSKIAIKKVGRKTSHKVSLQRNLINNVVIYEHLTTTLAKSKIVISDFEKLITYIKSKGTDQEKYKVLMKRLNDEDSVSKLLEVYKKRFDTDRSGFLNVYKLDNRKGDSAKMVKIIVKRYVYKDIGKKISTKKVTKKAVGSETEKKQGYLEKEAIKNSTSGKSQLKGAAAGTIVKTRSGI